MKYGKLMVKFVEDEELDLPFELNVAEIVIDKKGKIKTYNRAKRKQETKKLIQEYESSNDWRERD